MPQHAEAEPTRATIVARLRELSTAVTQGREAVSREFTMRIPAEPHRDADLALSTAADMLAAIAQPVAGAETPAQEATALRGQETKP